MLASRPGDDYQLAREPLKLEAILARARKEGYGQNYRGWDQEGEDRLYRRTAAQ